jgi:predicted transcriptional regulator
MEKNNVRERIIEILKERPQGLTILEIANLVGMSRVTVSKYVYGLISEDVVYQRKIGPAKLCGLVIK